MKRCRHRSRLAGILGLWGMLLCRLGAQTLTGDYLAAKWTTRQGLPSDAVTAVLRARDGYLWVGTTAGLVRFDGARFLPLRLASPSGTNQLSITALCEDKAGRLWVGTQAEGLFCVAHETVRALGEADGLKAPGITCLAAGPGGELWIGTQAGLHRLAQEHMARWTRAEGLPSDVVLSVNVARSGNVWITTREGVCRFREDRITASEGQEYLPGRSGDFVGAYEDHHGHVWVFGDSFLQDMTESKRFNYFRAGDPVATRVWTLHESREGTLWIGTGGRGLFQFKAGQFEAMRLPDAQVGWDVRTTTSDEEDNVWLGTHNGGLVRLHPAKLHWLSVKTRFGGAVSALAEDAGGRLWASVNGEGLQVIHEGASGPAEAPGLVGLRHVLALCVGTHNALWSGTWGAGVYRLDRFGVAQFTMRDGLSDDLVTAVCASRDTSAFIGTGSGDVHYFSPQRGWVKWGSRTLPQSITALLQARDQALWVGTDGGGLWRLANETAAPESVSPALRQAVIRTLAEDEQGRLWAGTAAQGLACIQGEQVRLATTETGAPDNAILQMVFDASRNLWLGTERGIYKVSRAAAEAFAAGEALARAHPVGQAEPGADLRCLPARPGAVRTRDGRLWFATTRGVVGLSPDSIRTETAAAPVYVEEVLVNGEPARSPWARAETKPSVAISQPLRSLEIHFTALDLQAPEAVKFRYKLEGFEEEWNAEGPARSVRYGRLPPGHYRFRVMASDATGVWNEPGAELSFVVPTPFWRTWWFLAGTGVLALGVVAAGVRPISHRRLRRRLQHLQREQAMERERTRIARDMHDELGAKLTKVSFLGERLKSRAAQVPELRPHLDSIADTTRSLLKSLDEIVWAVNPRNDSLRHLADYLGQYADEYFQNTAVECAVTMPEALPDVPLSAERRHHLFLAFEEALNNVLKHSQATRLWVVMKLTKDTFAVAVKDNGRGFEDARLKGATTRPAPPPTRARGGNGLVNMQARLSDVGGCCRVSSVPGQGTQVEFELPFRNHPPALL